MKRRLAITTVEVIIAIFVLSMAITTVAYVFAGSVNRIGRSKILTQAAYAAQTVMEASLLVDPFQPQPTPAALGPAYPGFTYTVLQQPFAQDQAYYEVQVRVFHTSLPAGQPAAFVCALRPYGGLKQ